MLYKRNTTVAAIFIAAALFSNSCKTKEKLISVNQQNAASVAKMKLNNFWVIAAFYQNNQIEYAANKVATLSIANDFKSFTGETGCNSMRGPLTVNGDTIKFSHIAHTRRACEHSAMEQRLLQVLESANRYEIKNAELTLFQNDKPLVLFESYRN